MNFPAFAATVVPYLNVASHLDGVPYDRLLQDKGFGGYPSLAFMDADGNVIGKPNDRTVAAFSNSRDALMAIDAVRAKATAGDQKAQVELLFLEYTLGNIKAKELTSRIELLSKHVSAKQLAKAKQIGVDARTSSGPRLVLMNAILLSAAKTRAKPTSKLSSYRLGLISKSTRLSAPISRRETRTRFTSACSRFSKRATRDLPRA